MPNRLPYQRYCSLTDEEPEERGDDDWQFLDVVTVNVDIRE